MNNDSSTEAMIQAKGLTAPRVTKAHVDMLMAGLAFQALVFPGTTTTVAIASLNGFTVGLGMSACVSPENFDAEIGAKIAIENATGIAREKLWELEGYRLKKELEQLTQITAAPVLTGAIEQQQVAETVGEAAAGQVDHHPV